MRVFRGAAVAAARVNHQRHELPEASAGGLANNLVRLFSCLVHCCLQRHITVTGGKPER